MTVTLAEQLALFVITIVLFYFITKGDYDPKNAEGRTVAELLSVMTIFMTCFLPQLKELFLAPVGKVLLIPQIGTVVFFAIMIYTAAAGSRHKCRGLERYLIIPGCCLESGKPGVLLTGRLEAALKLLQEDPELLAVVSGGFTGDGSAAESHAMKNWLTDHEIESGRIIIEDRSLITYDNFVFSLELLKDRGYTPDKPVKIVTDSFHFYRCAKLAKAAGFENFGFEKSTSGIKKTILWRFREVLVNIKTWIEGPACRPREKKK